MTTRQIHPMWLPLMLGLAMSGCDLEDVKDTGDTETGPDVEAMQEHCDSLTGAYTMTSMSDDEVFDIRCADMGEPTDVAENSEGTYFCKLDITYNHGDVDPFMVYFDEDENPSYDLTGDDDKREASCVGDSLESLDCGSGASLSFTPDCEAIDLDGDGYGEDVDCDDSDPAVYPDAVEACDGIDNNCNSEIDEGLLSTFYADEDADGYGDETISTEACEVPDGYVASSAEFDCDDQEPSVYPGAEEICDGLDNDCNAEADDGTALGSSSECPGSSCLDILEADPSAADGEYYIDPNGDTAWSLAYCDMTTDGGGYTMLKVDNFYEVGADEAEEYCETLGMQLLIPRTEAHQLAAVAYARDASIDLDYGNYSKVQHMFILGIYPTVRGASCTYQGFNSDTCTSWEASDSGPFFIGSRTDLSEPNGDNNVEYSMHYYWDDADDEIYHYNDASGVEYVSQYYICDVGDKWGDGKTR